MTQHSVQELYTQVDLEKKDRGLDRYPSMKRDQTEIYTSVNVGGDQVMITAAAADWDFHHPIHLGGVRGATQIQTRLSNVALAAAFGRQLTQPVEISRSTQAALDFFKDKLGEEFFWVARSIYFPGGSDSGSRFPEGERLFAIEPARGFELQAWDGRKTMLIGATKSIGYHLIAPAEVDSGPTPGTLHSVTAYPERLAICHISD